MTCFAKPALAALCLALAAPAFAQIAPPDPPPSAAQQARTLRELIARYHDWRGGFAVEELQTIHERFTLENAAGRQPGQLWLTRDGSSRRETTTDAGRLVEVATPDGAWRSLAGAPPTNDPGAFERARRAALLMFGDALAGRGGAQVTLAGTTDLDDKTWSVVRISFGDADIYDALLDPETGGLCCYQITEAGVKRTEMLGDWRLIDGVRMPFAELIQSTTEMGMRVGSLELNKPIDPALFAKPPA
ncbi:MAG TPA: hypothetical protein VHW60_23715 [Caulobacteraceae bacterium]|jgi:hypothetical protein|nr:hypothetical protein [Caulobacteraceae bacterium]